MYIRFTVDNIDPVSHKRMGIFFAIRELRDNNELLPYELEHMNEVMSWFADNLEKPDKFSRSNRNNAQDKAISWYKETAKEHIKNMFEIVSVLESHGIYCNILKTEKPGFIVYEDDYQVFAEPFTDTKA